MRTNRNYYAILRVPPSASQNQIRQSFRRLARVLHPDVNKHPDATRQFQELNEAYRVLSDPEARAKYDRYADEWGTPKAQSARRAQKGAARHQAQEAARRRQAEEAARRRREAQEETVRVRQETLEAVRIQQERLEWEALSRQREAEARSQWEADQERRREEEEAARAVWEQQEAGRIERERQEYEELLRQPEAEADQLRREREEAARQGREEAEAVRALWEKQETRRIEREQQEYEDLRQQREAEAEANWQAYVAYRKQHPMTPYASFVRESTSARQSTPGRKSRAPFASTLVRTVRRWWAVRFLRYAMLADTGLALLLLGVVLVLIGGTPKDPAFGAAGPSAVPPVDRIDRIAFALFHDNQQDIFAGTITGGEGGIPLGLVDIAQLTHSQSGEFANSPTWSSNGQRIFYNSNSTHLYVMDSTGAGQTPVSSLRGLGPRVARNNTTFVFEARPEGAVGNNTEIFLASTRAPNPVRLTNVQGVDEQPRISPDGRSIIFQSQRANPTATDEDTAVIYVMNSDGSNQRPVSNGPVFGMTPSWSPDGARIAYAGNRHNLARCDFEDCHSEIYVMNADGSQQTRLTLTSAGENQDTAWSPDGKWIAFYSNRDGSWELYAVSVDGSQLTRLTTFNFKDLQSWNTRFWGIDWR